jgi:hypothetical protein
MGNDNNSKKQFYYLIKQLEYLMLKCTNSPPPSQTDEYYNLYFNMDIDILKKEIEKSFTNCEKEINKKLNSSDYTPDSLVESKTIDKYIQNLIEWKNKCPSNNQKYFVKTKGLLDKIQNKDLQFTEQMDIDDKASNAHTSSNNIQIMGLVNKDEVIRIQELTLLNDNFGRALASLECFANRCSGLNNSNVFGYYDMFNLGKTQDLLELQKKALLQTQIFNLSYQDYIKKHTHYNAPENINLLQIKNLVTSWMAVVPTEQKFIYQGMIDIICSLSNTEFENKFKSYSEQCRNAKMDPKKIASFAPAVYYYNHQRCKEAKNQYLNEGKISSNLNINKKFEDDKNGQYMQNNILMNQKIQKEDELYHGDLK